MLRKIAKLITNNFGLKILAAAFAVVLWLMVMNVEDPERTKMFSIPVSIENADYLTKMDKTYEVLDNTDKMSIIVTAKRSVIEELSESDFSAIANMENINEAMTMVPITVEATRYKDQIEINKKSAYISVNVENLVTERITIEAIVEGEPASNCYVNQTIVNPKKVTVSGPESVVKKIKTAQVTVDVSGAEENIATNRDIVLLDENGNAVSQERLSLNRTKAAVDVVIMMGKTADLNFKTTGNPAEGYRCEEVTGSVEKVRLTGAPEVLDNLEVIDIDASQLSIEGVTNSFDVTIDLEDYLPEGVSLAEGEPSTVKVSVTIVGQETRSFAVPTANITVTNLPEDMELSFAEETITVKLRGFKEELDKISVSDLRGTLDASGLKAGRRNVSIQLQGEYTLAETIRAAVILKEKETGGTGSQPEDNNTNGDGGTGTVESGEENDSSGTENNIQ